jgi:hypothetical protein
MPHGIAERLNVVQRSGKEHRIEMAIIKIGPFRDPRIDGELAGRCDQLLIVISRRDLEPIFREARSQIASAATDLEKTPATQRQKSAE